MRSNQLNTPIFNVYIRYSILVGIYIAQVSYHSLFIIGGAVIATKGVEDRSTGGETLGEVAEDMDVDTVLALDR